MTLPLSVRIFFAIDLPSSTKDKMGAFIEALKKRSKSQGIRWSRSENLHITLQFLPEVASKDLPTLITSVRHALNHQVDYSLIELGSLHLFPSAFHPRVIVLDVKPQEQLTMLSKEIGSAIQSAGYEIEKRSFKAHLTIGRIKNMRKASLTFLSEFKMPPVEPMPIKKVVLFRSEPKPEGSLYTVLDEIALQPLQSSTPPIIHN